MDAFEVEVDIVSSKRQLAGSQCHRFFFPLLKWNSFLLICTSFEIKSDELSDLFYSFSVTFQLGIVLSKSWMYVLVFFCSHWLLIFLITGGGFHCILPRYSQNALAGFLVLFLFSHCHSEWWEGYRVVFPPNCCRDCKEEQRICRDMGVWKSAVHIWVEGYVHLP